MKSRRHTPRKIPRRKQLGISDNAVAVAFLIIIVILVMVFSTETQVVKQDQIKLLNQLVVENRPGAVVGSNVDNDMLRMLASRDYAEIKEMLGITSDFVIYFEDESGNLVEVMDKPCIGSAYAQVNGYRCDN